MKNYAFLLTIIFSYSILLIGCSRPEVKLYNAGWDKLNAGEYEEALKLADEAIAIRSDYALAYNLRSAVKRLLGDLSGSDSDIKKAIELKSDEPKFYYNSCLTKRKLHDFTGMLVDAQKGLEIVPDYRELVFHRALALSFMNNPQEAIRQFNKILESNFNDARTIESLYYKGEAYMSLNNWDDAAENFLLCENMQSKLDMKFQTENSINFNLALIAFYKSDYPTVSSKLQNVEEGSIEDFDLYNALMFYIAERKQGKSGKDIVDKVLNGEKKEWPYPVFQYYANQINIDKLLNIAPDYPEQVAGGNLCEACFYIAEYQLLKGDKRLAEKYFNKCIDDGIKGFIECNKAELELLAMKK